MKTERYIVIRSTERTSGGTRRFGEFPRGGSSRAPEHVVVGGEDLTLKDYREVCRDPETRYAVPAVPMKLHRPRPRRAAKVAKTRASWGIAAVGADKSPFTGAGVRVAVLDTGIDARHAAFAGMDLLVHDFTGDGDGDVDGHGTHCAGTIFGKPVDGVRIGVSPGIASGLIGKVVGTNGCSSETLVRAIQWAVDSGAHIVSMSLGIDFPGLVASYECAGYPTELATSKALIGYRSNIELFAAVVDYHARRMSGGVLFVAAAGNESRRDERADYVITVGPPAAADGMISVGALGKTKSGFTVAPYSNVGSRVCAPGSEIVSAKIGGGLVSESGTSMATPHVAGVAALWAQKVIQRDRFDIRQIQQGLEGSATRKRLGSATFEDVGHGLVQAPRS